MTASTDDGVVAHRDLGAATIEAADGERRRCSQAGQQHVVDADDRDHHVWPVPKLVIVGSGAVADALPSPPTCSAGSADVTNDVADRHRGRSPGWPRSTRSWWRPTTSSSPAPPWRRALASEVGYIGALGSRRMQQARADWLAYRGITDLDRIHGPAGLDIGAETPAEIAVAILAEALVRHPDANRWRHPNRRMTGHELGPTMARPDDAVTCCVPVWAASGRPVRRSTGLELDPDCGPTKICKNMKDVSFDGMAEPGSDLGEAWRDKLRREGKLSTAAGSIRDLVLGPSESS